MSALRRVATLAAILRPVIRAITAGDQAAAQGGALALAEGDPAVTEALGRMLGLISSRARRPDEDLLLIPVGPTADAAVFADRLAERKAAGGRAMAVLVGPRTERKPLERVFLSRPGVELDDLVQIAALDDEGLAAIGRALMRRLGDEAIAAARRHPRLRGPIADEIVRRASVRAALLSGLPFATSEFLILGALQVRMVGEIAALYDDQVDAEAVAQAAAVVGAGFGWRTVARSGTSAIPLAGPALRAGIAYGSTRALGELAHRRAAGGHPRLGRLPAAVRGPADRVMQRLPAPLRVAGAHEGSSG